MFSGLYRTTRKVLENLLIIDMSLVKGSGTYPITGYLQDFDSREMVYNPAGLLQTGDKRGFFYPSYASGTASIAIEDGDWVIDAMGTYRVFRTSTLYLGTYPVYLEAWMRQE